MITQQFYFYRLQDMRVLHWDMVEVRDFCEMDAREYLEKLLLERGMTEKQNVDDGVWKQIFDVCGGNPGRGDELFRDERLILRELSLVPS